MQPRLSRRHLLGQTTAAVGLALAGAGGARSQTAGRSAATHPALTGSRLYADVVRYADFGDHRTATDADVASSRWLADELRAAGFATELAPWQHQQFFIDAHRLAVADAVIDSFPLWWPRATGPEGVNAPLALLRPDAADGALRGRIGLVSTPPVRGLIVPGNGIGDAVEQAARQSAVGLVMINESPMGEIVALNAMAGLDPWPIPVLIAGQRDAPALQRAAESGAAASMLIDGTLIPDATAYEVIGRLDRGGGTIVVSTPSSGWFSCAGERGPGIAIWLALARWAASARPDASFCFVASSGHELDAVGIRQFFEHAAPEPGATRSWLHLGAGIATYAYETGPTGPRQTSRPDAAARLQTNDAEVLPKLEQAFGRTTELRPMLTERPGGEMSYMASRGYQVWGLAGLCALHHMPIDLPARITGPELLEPVARASAQALELITD